MNYIKITKNDIANGEGIGVVLWVSGCKCHCYNCHNLQSWDFNAGQPFTEDTIQELFQVLCKPYISRLTLSGGHPLEPENLSTVYNIVKTVRENFPDKSIWIYSGYTFEKIKEIDEVYEKHEINCPSPLDILKYCDTLVDGAYVDELRNLTLPFRGSSNQRIIDIKKSLAENKIVLWQSK